GRRAQAQPGAPTREDELDRARSRHSGSRVFRSPESRTPGPAGRADRRIGDPGGRPAPGRASGRLEPQAEGARLGDVRRGSKVLRLPGDLIGCKASVAKGSDSRQVSPGGWGEQ